MNLVKFWSFVAQVAEPIFWGVVIAAVPILIILFAPEQVG